LLLTINIHADGDSYVSSQQYVFEANLELCQHLPFIDLCIFGNMNIILSQIVTVSFLHYCQIPYEMHELAVNDTQAKKDIWTGVFSLTADYTHVHFIVLVW